MTIATERRPSTRKDRAIAKIVSFLARATYRDIEVYWPPTPDRPVDPADLAADGSHLVVSNHFGGFSDALVLLHVLPRRPGIVARDVIWRIPVVGALMNWVGGIPVHKPEDRGEASGNDQMFASCYKALEHGDDILIFPEGVTRNEPSIARVKTGAARIALGARAHGADGLSVVPVGIHYEDKAALRSRVFVNAGVPLDLDLVVPADPDRPDAGADDREAVTELTDAIDLALRRSAPDYADWDEARLLTQGAEIALRAQFDDPTAEVPIGLRDRLANTLAERSTDERRRIQDAVDDYRHDLDGLGVTDAELYARLGTGRFARSLVWNLLVGLFLLPFALAGALVNLIPFLIVKAVGMLRVAPSVHSSIKPVTAFFAFAVTWGVVIWWTIGRFGWEIGVAVAILLPVYLAATIVLVERSTLLWRLVRRWRRRSAADGFEEHLATHRAAVVEAVLA